MILRPLLLAAAAASVLAACAPNGGPSMQSPPAQAVMKRDVHSFARPAEARVTHVDLDLRADFAAKTLSGQAALDVTAAPDAKELVLDTRDLDVQSVADGRGKALQWALGAQGQGVLGRPLVVQLPRGTRKVVVSYRTSPGAAALQWLTPEQTAGKKHPYLLSQGQAILTRSWVPTQDSPGIRQTYSARITVPEPLKAVMSAEMLTPNGEPAGAGWRTFRFRMPQAIPPYLMAIAVGDIAFRPIGPKTGVYSEPSMVDAAAREFVDVDRMMEAAERLYGPYRWGRYDMLVLPPSFPYGGMENPRLTFLTPTLLAGDRSLVGVVAHELAHSWSGNLVTNADWSDFWLNEGFTSYFENRIMEAVYGRERALMEASLEFRELRSKVAEHAADSGKTRLHQPPSPTDPDEGATEVAYEKGAAMLATIENIVGRSRFDAWLRSYFDRHAFQPMTSERFLQDIRTHLVRGDQTLEARLKLDEWVYQPGLPDNVYVPQSPAFAAVETQAKAFAAGGPASAVRTQGWTTQEWLHFLGALPKEMPQARLADLERTFDLSNQRNSEVLFAWLETAVRNRYEPAVPALERFLTAQGRRKFVLPLFRALMAEGEWGQSLAKRIYARARPGYHPVTTGSVDPVVKL